MAIFNHQSPVGYRYLRTYQQGIEIEEGIKNLTASLPRLHPITRQPMTRFIDQTNSSARSVPRNIVEGFKRASTGEYIKFLGYSLGSLEELSEDLKSLERDVLKTSAGWSRLKLGDIQYLIRLCHGEDKMLNGQIASLERKRNKEGYKTPQESIRIMRKQDNFWENFRRSPEVIFAMKDSDLVDTDCGLIKRDEAAKKGAKILFDPRDPYRSG